MEEGVSDAIENEDGILYHYTDQKGLLGILETRSIWATHAAHLNDASEFTRGLAIARQSLDNFVLKSQTDEGPRPSGFFARKEFEKVIAEKFHGALRIVDEMDVFISSFFDGGTTLSPIGTTDSGDVLNQWRSYSPRGSGFSIGFDKGTLTQHIGEMKNRSCLISCAPCNYNEESQKEYIHNRISEFGSAIFGQLYSFIDHFNQERIDITKELLQTISYRPTEQELRALKEAMAMKMLGPDGSFYEEMEKELHRVDREIITRLADIMIPPAFMKHPSFDVEKEWRIAQFDFRPKAQVKFRPGQSSLIPYREIPLPLDESGPNLIKRIVVGPSPKMGEAVAATQMLLRCYGYAVNEHGSRSGIEVVPSQLPFRSW